MGPWAALFLESQLLRANRGQGEHTEQGVASPTFLPRLPSFAVGRKETGKSLGRRWGSVGVGELRDDLQRKEDRRHRLLG